MGTKIDPGEYDCYANARPDEPMFVLLARDERAPAVVREWARLSRAKGTDPKKIAEALKCAEAMERWRAEHAEEFATRVETIEGEYKPAFIDYVDEIPNREPPSER